MDRLKKTANMFVCEGTLYEKALSLEGKTTEVKTESGIKHISNLIIKGKIAVKTGNGIITFPIYVQKVTKSGKDNFQWKWAQKAVDEWKPLINGEQGRNDSPTRLCLKGELTPYRGEDRNGIKFYNVSFRVNSAYSIDSFKGATGLSAKVNGYIMSIDEENEENSSVKFNLICVDYFGKPFPIPVIAEGRAAQIIKQGSVSPMFEQFASEQTRTGICLSYFNKPITVEHSEETSGVMFFVEDSGPKLETTQIWKSGFFLVGADPEPIEQPMDEEEKAASIWMDPKDIAQAMRAQGENEDKTSAKQPIDIDANEEEDDDDLW